jgi:hypothetical protein|tara:strand:+ start:2424 stop:2795 length:372 start_codon:yes stop_codon:yes gene_type:complete
MGFKIKGKIASIGQKKILDNGAVVLDYVVSHTSENGFVTPYSFNIYKSSEYIEHLDNFLSFNNVGDNVEVEFNIRGKEYNGKVYNSLSHWRIEKEKGASMELNEPVAEQETKTKSVNDDVLPF